MSLVKIQMADIDDAAILTDIKKNVFDAEKVKWLSDQEDVVDYNIQPPGYDCIETGKYMIRELNYYKVLYDGEMVGGLIVTVVGKRHGRVDRIFIEPRHQGKGIGTEVMKLMEGEFPKVKTWELETSSRQVNNHQFYEKAGYRKVFQSEDEFCYEKKKPEEEGTGDEISKLTILGDTLKDVDLSEIQVEHSKMVKTDFYAIDGSHSSFSNSNLSRTHFSNCNLSHARFQNINLQHTLIADLNLSHSEFVHVTLGGVHIHDTTLGVGDEPMKFERCELKGSRFQNCNMTNVELSDCDLRGMKINGILVKDLLEAYTQVKR
ncbi:GNAT family N-acetyltransferase (plasmid) [Cytobacillus spongiae]|uniref:GNAT family N-acetyltransferase n=1 Tax=Cytobacillus spongiae TaxID=2901381 RepID=UPI001F3011CF|nr:GNAT family N-acetyltransferase [Cytobacillus spongiae]UII58238.1 GNAT family N-acetyltransferase [Cytobacillus spongiae]